MWCAGRGGATAIERGFAADATSDDERPMDAEVEPAEYVEYEKDMGTAADEADEERNTTLPPMAFSDYHIPLKAFYIGKDIDFRGLTREFTNLPHSVQKDSVIVKLTSVSPSDKDIGKSIGPQLNRYMVVFSYGSVVFFNVEDKLRQECLDVAAKYAKNKFSIPCTEDYGVTVRPTMARWSSLGNDSLTVKRLDVNNIRVISSILGQTVALDHYALKVDAMLETFGKINNEMEATGELTISKPKLFMLVATNNNTLTDVITKLRLLDRSDTAWKYAQYGEIWDGMRSDFELEDRFETIDLKLNIIQNNVKFFLEVLQNRKSDTLEWIIIVLISLEIAVALYDMSRSIG